METPAGSASPRETSVPQEAVTHSEDSPLSARTVLAFPFTGSGPVLWVLVAFLAAIPWGSLLGWVVSIWVMVRVIESTAKGGRRIPPLPKGPEVQRELQLFGRALAVAGVIFLPLWAIFVSALLRWNLPDFPAVLVVSEVILGLGLLGTLLAVLFILPALVRVVEGAYPAEAIVPKLLKDDLQRIGGLAIFLLVFGGFAAIVLTGLLDRLGAPGAFVARAFSYGLQIAVAFATGLAITPRREYGSGLGKTGVR